MGKAGGRGWTAAIGWATDKLPIALRRGRKRKRLSSVRHAVYRELAIAP
jgi:hypothetical protein